MEILEEETVDTSKEPEKEAEKAEDASNADNNGMQMPSNVCVYVCGAVVNPGVYSLPENSRKYQAIEMAGGMTETAASQALNLAEAVVDGEKIQVPTLEEVESGSFSAENSGQSQGNQIQTDNSGGSGLVNINQADVAMLMTLPGIGEGKANSIIAYRQEHGGFSTLEELMQVEGIKQGVFDKVKNQICI